MFERMEQIFMFNRINFTLENCVIFFKLWFRPITVRIHAKQIERERDRERERRKNHFSTAYFVLDTHLNKNSINKLHFIGFPLRLASFQCVVVVFNEKRCKIIERMGLQICRNISYYIRSPEIDFFLTIHCSNIYHFFFFCVEKSAVFLICSNAAGTSFRIQGWSCFGRLTVQHLPMRYQLAYVNKGWKNINTYQICGMALSLSLRYTYKSLRDELKIFKKKMHERNTRRFIFNIICGEFL